jgi:hypothetical protein
VREHADGGAWEAQLRLLHGLAAIGTPDAAQTALAAANRLHKLIGRVPGQDPGPRWPLHVRRLRADGDVVRLRDVWGTRYAVIAGFSYGGRDRSVFLLDVDTDFYNIVVSAGDFDDTDQAAAAWRQSRESVTGRRTPRCNPWTTPTNWAASSTWTWTKSRCPRSQTHRHRQLVRRTTTAGSVAESPAPIRDRPDHGRLSVQRGHRANGRRVRAMVPWATRRRARP